MTAKTKPMTKNPVKEFLSHLSSHRKKKEVGGDSGSIARSRLKNALVKDRSDGTTELLDMLAADLLKVVNCYMEVAGGASLQLKPATQMEGTLLLCQVPIKNLRRVKA